MHSDKLFLRITRLTLVFALIVIVLGAYTRLSHAGLGCPDWPGCYGRLIVPADESVVAEVSQMYPDRPLEQHKAWKEMVHRYAAGILGLLILVLSMVAWKRRQVPGQALWVPLLLLGLVVFQALLGMWTVTLLLKPVVVMGHLLGGMTLLLLLVWLLLCQLYPESGKGKTKDSVKIFPWALLGLVVLYVQISLGGWTSANYAALICPDFPTCQGVWWPRMDFSEGFLLWRGLGVDYEFGVLNTEARTAIHMSHRLGAVLTFFLVGAIAVRSIIMEDHRIRLTGLVLLGLLILQLGLGLANVMLGLPLAIAVAHNAVATLLLACAGALVYFSKRST